PRMFTANGSYEIPKIEVQFSANFIAVQGIPYGAQLQARLPQGTRNVYFAAPGDYRLPNQKWLQFRAEQILFPHGQRYVELGVELRNALQELSIDTILSRVYTSPNFGLPSQYPIPRQLLFRARGYF